MKISNLFKKTTKTATATVQKLEKKQLEKVIGGTDELAGGPRIIKATVKGNTEVA